MARKTKSPTEREVERLHKRLDKAEGQLRRAREREARLRDRLEEQSFELRLDGALRRIASDPFLLDDLLDDLLRVVLDRIGADAGTLFDLDPETGELIFRIVRGSARDDLLGQRLKRGEGIAGHVAETGKPHLALDVSRDPLWRDRIARTVGYPTRDILCVPVKRGRRVTAVIQLLNKHDGEAFSNHDLELAMRLAKGVGRVSHAARRHHGVQRRVDQFTTLIELSRMLNSTLEPQAVRRRAMEAATHLLDCEVGSLLLLDKERQELFFEVALGEKGEQVKEIRLALGEGIAGWVAQHDKPVRINDCASDPRFAKKVDKSVDFVTRTMVCVPVRMRGEVIGVLEGINRRTGHFTEDDVELLFALAAQVAIAIDNARLFAELRRTFLETAEALAEAIDLRDPYTGGHTRRVVRYSLATARRLGVGGPDRETLRFSAILHDIGKIGVEDDILRKPGKLTEEEMAQMREHPDRGCAILSHIDFFHEAMPGLRSHHERHDGKGYPDRLTGEAIPLLARIIAVADTFDAMTSDRPYRKGLPHEVALEEIRRCAGSQFDPEVAEAFLAAYEAGEIVTSER